MKKPVEKTIAPLGSKQVELAFQTVLSDGDLFRLLVDLVELPLFSAEELYLAICWRAATDLLETNDVVPKVLSICAAVKDMVTRSADSVSPVQKKLLNDFLYRLKRSDPATLDSRESRSLIKRWIEERRLDGLRVRLQDRNNPTSISMFLEEFKGQLDSVAHIEGGGSRPVFDDTDDLFVPETSKDLFPTGYKFLDQMMDGGQAPEEVMLLMAPYSAGKTALATSMWYEAGRTFSAMRRIDKGAKRRVAVLAVYEAGRKEIQSRLVVYGAKIPFDRVKTIQSKSDYSTVSNLQPYERQMFHNVDAIVKPEIVRIREMQRLSRDHLLLLDMTESNASVRAGQGDVAEIVAKMRDYGRQNPDVEFGWVGIDYAGVMVDNHAANNRALAEPNAFRRWLSKSPMRCKNQLAIPFKSPVWLVHQLNAESNHSPPSRIPRHTDGAESKTMGENPNFCFCIGTPTKEGVRIFNRSKGRRLAGDSDETVLVRLDKNHGKYVVVNDFVMHEGRIKGKDMVHTVRDAEQIKALTRPNQDARRVDRSVVNFQDEVHETSKLG
jgi:hypothetical protein